MAEQASPGILLQQSDDSETRCQNCGKGMLELIEEWPHPLFGVLGVTCQKFNATIAVTAAIALRSARTDGAQCPSAGSVGSDVTQLLGEVGIWIARSMGWPSRATGVRPPHIASWTRSRGSPASTAHRIVAHNSATEEPRVGHDAGVVLLDQQAWVQPGACKAIALRDAGVAAGTPAAL
jgi:hypothetical protein